MMKTYVPKKTEGQDVSQEALGISRDKLDMRKICASDTLDGLLASHQAKLNVSYNVPRCEGASFISEKTTGIDLPPEIQFMGTAGLGLKRKTENQQNSGTLCGSSNNKLHKAKTLYEKRIRLQEEIMKYGVAAVEKMYPRQLYFKKPSPVKSAGTVARPHPIKMKPKPSFDFAEVDARKILKPYSHDKYIHQPPNDRVVYISRRRGLVPLSSLCKDATILLPKEVKFLSGRNVSLGKPEIYIKDSGRILAIGGSRTLPREPFYPQVIPTQTFRVVKVPKLTKKPENNFHLFQMDQEYANFAVSSLKLIPKRFLNRIDIRSIKRQQRSKTSSLDLKSSLKEKNQSIISHLLEKFDPKAKDDDNLEEFEDPQPTAEERKVEVKSDDENRLGVEATIKVESDDPDESFDEDQPDYPEDDKENIFNKWTDNVRINFDAQDDKPVVTESFRQSFDSRKSLQKEQGLLNGFEECDVDNCFCRDESQSGGIPTGGLVTEPQTPTANTSGTQTPVLSESSKEDKKKVSKNLTKVRRALKVLGVNFFEFDDENGYRANDRFCDKEFCRLGCICDTLVRKPLAPAHCGKYDCMFACTCSEDSLKIATSSAGIRRGLTDTGSMVQLRSSSLRGMALEERKFVNTVVATGGGGDLLMLGTSAGRQKRERKVPSRYQDTDAFDASGLIDQLCPSKLDDSEDLEGQDVGTMVTSLSGIIPNEDPQSKLLKEEHLREETIKKCTILLPRLELPETVKPWCMYHCQYTCPCSKYIDPLEYGPDLGARRNVSKRTLGGVFKTKRQTSPSKRPQLAKRSAGKLPFRPVKLTFTATDDDMPTSPKHAEKTYKFATEVHSARTAGIVIKAQLKTHIPQKLVLQKKDNLEIVQKMTTLGVNETNLVRAKKQQQDLGTAEKDADKFSFQGKTGDSNPVVIRTISDELDLSMHPKGDVQYIRWNVLRHKFESKEIMIWCYFRNGRPAIFVAKYGDLPYVRQAFDVREFKKRTGPAEPSLPPLVDAMVLEEGKGVSREEDLNKYGILTSNGLAWEMNGVLQRKNPIEQIKKSVVVQSAKPTIRPVLAINPQLPLRPPLPIRPNFNGLTNVAKVEPLPPQQPPTEESLSCTISLEVQVAKLPVGKSLVTMTKNGQPVMQVKLPVTSQQQHWSTIKLDGREGSVQCPESSLALKVVVLKQAASLAMTEQTTVRIPIPVSGETESFGVYAVPGLQSHVFVGPFTSKTVQKSNNKPTELICLDDDEGVANIDDEVQEIVQNDPTTSNDAFIIDFGEQPNKIPHVMSIEQNRELRKKLRQYAIMGQIPIVVSKPTDTANDVEVVNIADDEDLNPKFEKSFPHKTPLPASEYGRIVYRQEKSGLFEDEASMIWVDIPDHGEIRVHFTPDRVTFPHPTYPSHEVVCSNLDNMRRWMREFKKQKIAERQLPSVTNGAILKNTNSVAAAFSKSAVVGTGAGAGTSAGVGTGTGTQGIQPRPKQHVSKIFDNGGQKSAAILLDRRQERDKRKLLNKLNEVVFSNVYHRNLTSVEILTRAVEQINDLTHEQQKLESDKKNLMCRRTKLFEEFTQKLNGLPVAVKKKAVLDLKELLKKDSTPKPGPSASNVAAKPAPTQEAQPESQPEIIIPSTAEPSTSVPSVSPCTPYSDVTGLQTIKKDGKVMRPMNAFMLWAKGYRRELISQGFDGATVSKLLADKWKVLPDEQKHQFYQEADHLKNLHHLQHPNYKYSPKARRPGLPKKSPPKSGNPSDKPVGVVEPLFLPASQAFPFQGPPTLTPRPGLVRMVVPQGHQDQQQMIQGLIRPRMPGLIQMANNSETKKNIIEISLD